MMCDDDDMMMMMTMMVMMMMVMVMVMMMMMMRMRMRMSMRNMKWMMNADEDFVRACAVEIHVHMSQETSVEPLYKEIYRTNAAA